MTYIAPANLGVGNYSAPNNPSNPNNTATADAKPPVMRLLLLSELLPSILNPRKHFGVDELTDLANDIAMNGVLQPLTVRPDGDDPYGGWQIVMGERRYRAAKQAGLESVPCIIRDDLDDAAHLRLAFSENAKRADLTPIENAQALSKMLELEPALTQSGLGHRLGISQSKVANGLRLLKLPFLVQRNLESGRLSESVGIVLCGLLEYPDTLETIAERAATEAWTQTLAEAKVKETKQWCEQQAKEREGQMPLPLENLPAAPTVPVAMAQTAVSESEDIQETEDEENEQSEAGTPQAPGAPAAEANTGDAKAVAESAAQTSDAVTVPQVVSPAPAAPVPPATPATIASDATPPATAAPAAAAPTASTLPVPTTRKPVTGLLWDDQQEWLAGQGLTVMTGLDRLRLVNPSPEAMEALNLLTTYYSDRAPGQVPLTLGETLDIVVIVCAENKGLIPSRADATITATTTITDSDTSSESTSDEENPIE